ncbi:hypothetical protein [Pseudomonas fluorescens]|uniref:hypothetical protein n=1 Tax=Pseudomonas TaxID=286 RepID=UPI003D01ACF9
MKHYRILCYRSKFDEFKKASSERINKIPAENNDDFALLASVDKKGSVGFDKTSQGCAAIKSLVSSCYYVDIDGKLQSPSTKELNYMPLFMFRDKGGEFEEAVSAHRQYEKDIKRYAVLSRYRGVEKPEPAMLTGFLLSDGFSISLDVYELLKNTCHYVAIAKISGEYGYGAFDVFSSSLDFFFDEFSSIAGESAEWVMVDKPSEFIST